MAMFIFNIICVIGMLGFAAVYAWSIIGLSKTIAAEADRTGVLNARPLTWLMLCGIVAIFLGAAGFIRDGIQLSFFGFMAGIIAGYAPFMAGLWLDETSDDSVLLLTDDMRVRD